MTATQLALVLEALNIGHDKATAEVEHVVSAYLGHPAGARHIAAARADVAKIESAIALVNAEAAVDERMAFEKLARWLGLSLERGEWPNEDGYHSRSTHGAWLGWKGRAALHPSEGPTT